MENTVNLYTVGNYTLEKSTLFPENKNEVIQISALVSDLVERVVLFPVCEVRQLPDLKKPIHFINDKEAQKMILSFHRYGPADKTGEKFCPFAPGMVRDRLTSLIGKNNLTTTFEGQSQKQRQVLLSFFTKSKLEHIRKECTDITEIWLQKQIELEQVLLFDSCLHLVGECLIKGILGYSDCTAEEVNINVEYWKNILSNKPTELKSASEFESEEGSLFTNIRDYCYDGIDLLKKVKTFLFDSAEIDTLCHRIFDATFDIKDSLVNHLSKNSFNDDEIIENIKGMLLAGQETTGYLLSFLLYEYARNPEMQKMHTDDHGKIECAYLEALRLYSVGGAIREADMDMTLTYVDAGWNKKEHFIRKGDLINIIPFIAGHNPNEWNDPEIFNPDRENLEAVRDIPHFGSGPHRCIGEKVSKMEIVTCMSHILSNATIQTDETLPPLAGSFTLRPIHDMSVQFCRKR
jgi:cytochrome P450